MRGFADRVGCCATVGGWSGRGAGSEPGEALTCWRIAAKAAPRDELSSGGFCRSGLGRDGVRPPQLSELEPNRIPKRIITYRRDQPRAQRIGNDVPRHRFYRFVFPKRVIVVAALPNRLHRRVFMTNLSRTCALESPHARSKRAGFTQLNQPTDVIRHKHPSEQLGAFILDGVRKCSRAGRSNREAVEYFTSIHRGGGHVINLIGYGNSPTTRYDGAHW